MEDGVSSLVEEGIIESKMIDVEKYCTGCNSDKHTGPSPSGHHMLWCNVCWDYAKTLDTRLKGLILDGYKYREDENAS